MHSAEIATCVVCSLNCIKGRAFHFLFERHWGCSAQETEQPFNWMQPLLGHPSRGWARSLSYVVWVLLLCISGRLDAHVAYCCLSQVICATAPQHRLSHYTVSLNSTVHQLHFHETYVHCPIISPGPPLLRPARLGLASPRPTSFEAKLTELTS